MKFIVKGLDEKFKVEKFDVEIPINAGIDDSYINSDSIDQLIEDVKLAVGLDKRVELVNQYGGVPMSADEILDAVEKMTR